MVKFILLLTILSPGDLDGAFQTHTGTRTSTTVLTFDSQEACLNAGTNHQAALRTANGARVVAVFSCSPDR